MTTATTAIYRSIMLECERRRAQLGIPMWKVDELAGTQDGYYAKAVHADAPSGRQAQWTTLQWIVDALFYEGVEVILKGSASPMLTASSMGVRLRQMQALNDRKTQRELMRELGLKGALARNKNLKPKRRVAIARKAAKARWRRVREMKKQIRRPEATSRQGTFPLLEQTSQVS